MLRLQIEKRWQVEQFFDSREDLSCASDSCPISPVTCRTGPISPATCYASPVNPATFNASPISPAVTASPSNNQPNLISPGPYRRWMGDPLTVEDRRTEFRKWMCLTPTPTSRSKPAFIEEDGRTSKDGELQIETSTTASTSASTSRSVQTPTSRPVQTPPRSEGDSFSSNSRWSSEHSHSSKDSLPQDSILYKIANWDDGNASSLAKLEGRGGSRRFSDVISGELSVADGVPKSMMPQGFLAHFMRREDNGSTRSSITSSTSSEDSVGRRKRSWLKRLGMIACIVDREDDFEPSLGSYALNDHDTKKTERVKVHVFWKKCREFSAVYKEQDFTAHIGAIWAMKFSHDGRYLATGGEDGVVRIWSVTQLKRTGDDLLGDGLSCIRLSQNQTPIYVAAEKKKSKKNGKADPACIVVPPKVFGLSEEPLHSFHGHNGDILDLSWSKDKYLISSSLDKTVRLWQVGSENCIRVFRHNDYVTCVQFNPVEENFFISGSIDGKLRVWDISTTHVVDWSDMTEIVTAVCFRPDGKEVVAGSITGNCRFFKILDNRLQLDTDIPLHGKKGSTCKRVTGFQFSESDPSKLLVTSADSQVRVLARVLDKSSIVHKYKGFKNTGSLISASFTKDGRHIVSASEDSNVFIWSYEDNGAPVSRTKITRSYERFFSGDPSVAIPWNGFVNLPQQSQDFTFQTQGGTNPGKHPGLLDNTVHHQSSDCSASDSGSVLDSLRKGSSTTWPEENLPRNSLPVDNEQSTVDKSSGSACQSTDLPHSWGQVIVTAGCDGKIRVFCNYGLPLDK